MKVKHIIGDQSGMALVIALVMLLALTVLGISAITSSTIELQIASNERFAAEALALADSGIEVLLLDLLYDYETDGKWSNSGLWTLSSGVEDAACPACPLTNIFASDYPPLDSEWGDPYDAANLTGSIGNSVDPYGVQVVKGPDGNPMGRYRMLLLRKSGKTNEIYARSYAEHKTGSKKILEIHLELEKIDAWRNAVFSGAGSASASIEGNIKIAGSMHILGTGDTNPWTISGSTAVVNGYKGLADDWVDRINFDAIEIVEYLDGDPVYSLESVFRDKNMPISIEGSGNIGELGGTGSLDPGYEMYGGKLFKSTMDAVYSNKQILGDDKIFADEVQMPDGYDLGDKLQMPTFSDSYTNPNDPSDKYDTYEDYINENSTTIPSSLLGPNCLIDSTVDAFSVGLYNASAVCIDPKGCLKWEPNAQFGDLPGGGTVAKGRLTISGRVKYDDTNEFGPGTKCTMPADNKGYVIGDAGNNNYVTYRGKGLIYSAASLHVKGNLVTDNSDDAFGNPTKFAKDHLLGLLTKSNVHVGTDTTNGTVMVGIFAAGFIATEKDTSIIGSAVSNSFCLNGTDDVTLGCKNSAGTGSIYYVNDLPDAILELGMLKSRTVYTFKTYEWTEKD